MIVFNNLVFVGQISGGVSLVWKYVIRKFINHDGVLFLEYKHSMNNIFRQQLNIDEKQQYILKGGSYLNRLIAPGLKFINDKIIYITSEYNLLKRENVFNIIIIHDFIYELYSPKSFSYYFNVIPKSNAIRKSDAIICVSENTRRDLFTFFPSLPSEKVTVIHNGVSDDFKLNAPLSALFLMLNPQKYVVFIGARSSYKNFKLTVDSLHYSDLNLQLVIVSNQPLNRSEVTYLNQKLGCGRYFLFNKLSNSDLNGLYSNAFSLMYLSKYEGFGIPVLEAQRSGCPVIASVLSSIPEVGGNGYIPVETLDVQSVSNAIKKLLDQSVRIQIIEKGYANSMRFSWEKTSELYFDFINKACCQL